MSIPPRIAALQTALQRHGFAAALISHHRDVFYYTGTAQPCNLLIPATGEPVLFARRLLAWVRSEAMVDDVREASGFGPLSQVLRERGVTGGVLGVNADKIPLRLGWSLAKAFSGFTLQDVSPLVLAQKAIKEPVEIAAMERACRVWEQVHAAVLGALRPGLREIDVGAVMLAAARRAGAEDAVFARRWDNVLLATGFVASGPNAAIVSGNAYSTNGPGISAAVPWGASTRAIEPGDLVVIDTGFNISGYYCAFPRTYCAGKASPLARERYAALEEIYAAARAELRPGNPVKAPFLAALAKAEAVGLAAHFQGCKGQQGRYIGHSLGMEMDEEPVLDDGNAAPLQAGMVLTIEPKLLFPGWGAVSVEDTLLVTPEGARDLGRIPHGIFEC